MWVIHVCVLKALSQGYVVAGVRAGIFLEAALSNCLASPCNQRLTSDSRFELLELLGCEEQKLSVLPSVYGGGGSFFSLPLMY